MLLGPGPIVPNVKLSPGNDIKLATGSGLAILRSRIDPVTLGPNVPPVKVMFVF